MSVIVEAERLAFSLPESDRAKLASKLLSSLPSCSDDSRDGVAEALKRSQELKDNPEIAITHEEFAQFFADRHK